MGAVLNVDPHAPGNVLVTTTNRKASHGVPVSGFLFHSRLVGITLIQGNKSQSPNKYLYSLERNEEIKALADKIRCRAQCQKKGGRGRRDRSSLVLTDFCCARSHSVVRNDLLVDS